MPTARLAPDRLGTSTTASNWRNHAACKGMPLDVFFPTSQGDHCSAARKICTPCPVATYCLDDALAAGTDLAGIWAGTSQKQRRAILRGQPIPTDDKKDTPPSRKPTVERNSPLKNQAIALYRQARPLYTNNSSCYRAVAEQLGVRPQTVSDWIRKKRPTRPQQPATRPQTQKANPKP